MWLIVRVISRINILEFSLNWSIHGIDRFDYLGLNRLYRSIRIKRCIRVKNRAYWLLHLSITITKMNIRLFSILDMVRLRGRRMFFLDNYRRVLFIVNGGQSFLMSDILLFMNSSFYYRFFFMNNRIYSRFFFMNCRFIGFNNLRMLIGDRSFGLKGSFVVL